MDKLKMHTNNLADQNFQKLAELFPNAITETINENGEVVRAIDADVLRQEISTEVVEGSQERYQLTWPKKRNSIALANRPIAKTLRLDRGKSVGKNGVQGEINSENIYIEGDNLEALKLLQETYLGKVKMIYIDPPYNTGNDFIYKDDFSMNSNKFLEVSNQIDEEYNNLVQNKDNNGRFHTNWLNMIYPRLRLAKDLLSNDGIIFISIDDSEQGNLKKICDEIFGSNNFIAQCARKRRNSQANLSKNISPIHEYLLIYSKQSGNILNRVKANIDQKEYSNPDNDPRGPYKTMPCTNKGGTIYTIKTPKGLEITDEWRFKEDTFLSLLKDKKIIFPRNGMGKPRYKLFLKDKIQKGQLANTWLDNLGSNQDATKEIKFLFDGKNVFETAKPLNLLKFCIELATDTNSIVLDFFSGSSTTAEAVMQQNAEDGGNRQFIMIQIPEKTNKNKEAQKAGFKKICDIGEERIKRAGTKIKEQTGADIDYGFRVFKIDSSNLKDVYYNPSEIIQEQISIFTDNIKEDRTSEDLLIQIMLDLGISLSSKIEEIEINGKKVFNVNDGFLLACFDKDITNETVTQIAKIQPSYAIFRDSSMKDDSVIVNYDQIFKYYSPGTERKVL